MKFKYVIRMVKILVNIFNSGVITAKIIEMKGDNTIMFAVQNVAGLISSIPTEQIFPYIHKFRYSFQLIERIMARASKVFIFWD